MEEGVSAGASPAVDARGVQKVERFANLDPKREQLFEASSFPDGRRCYRKTTNDPTWVHRANKEGLQPFKDTKNFCSKDQKWAIISYCPFKPEVVEISILARCIMESEGIRRLMERCVPKKKEEMTEAISRDIDRIVRDERTKAVGYPTVGLNIHRVFKKESNAQKYLSSLKDYSDMPCGLVPMNRFGEIPPDPAYTKFSYTDNPELEKAMAQYYKSREEEQVKLSDRVELEQKKAAERNREIVEERAAAEKFAEERPIPNLINEKHDKYREEMKQLTDENQMVWQLVSDLRKIIMNPTSRSGHFVIGVLGPVSGKVKSSAVSAAIQPVVEEYKRSRLLKPTENFQVVLTTTLSWFTNVVAKACRLQQIPGEVISRDQPEPRWGVLSVAKTDELSRCKTWQEENAIFVRSIDALLTFGKSPQSEDMLSRYRGLRGDSALISEIP